MEFVKWTTRFKYLFTSSVCVCVCVCGCVCVGGGVCGVCVCFTILVNRDCGLVVSSEKGSNLLPKRGVLFWEFLWQWQTFLLSACNSNDVQPLSKTCKLQYFEVLTNNRHYSWVSTCQRTMSEQRLKEVICSAPFTYSSNLSNKTRKFWQPVFSYVIDVWHLWNSRCVHD